MPNPIHITPRALARALLSAGKATDLEHAARLADAIMRRRAAAAPAEAEAAKLKHIAGLLERDGYTPETAAAEARHLFGSQAAGPPAGPVPTPAITARGIARVLMSRGMDMALAFERADRIMATAAARSGAASGALPTVSAKQTARAIVKQLLEGMSLEEATHEALRRTGRRALEDEDDQGGDDVDQRAARDGGAPGAPVVRLDVRQLARGIARTEGVDFDLAQQIAERRARRAGGGTR